ncbi:isoprenylcysteine carboxylmethyltransferase family protein [Candidatus Gottesmanbacteria bacterium]|nr:isoprenylcysteine carboxylmethyltransferase family protein [Candidatus Gottesmanbacteria bacterium]
MGEILRFLSIILLILWAWYWQHKAIQTQKIKPEYQKDRTFIYLLSKYGSWVLDGFVILQLTGLSLLPTNFGLLGQSVGFILVCIGIRIAYSARITLDTNWSNAFDYQIKKKHELITAGIYNTIRHPIYTSMILAGTGAELVAETYIFIPTLILMFVWAYTQAKKEEQILSIHFGKSYDLYMNQSWMFLPYII